MSEHAQEIYRCTPRQVREFVTDCIQANLVPFVQSSPGMGKSSIVSQVADHWGLHLIDHRLSTSQPEDLSGLPDFYTDSAGHRRATFSPFDIFPLTNTPIPDGKNGWLIFLDEANSADKLVQAASYKLVLDKMVGQQKLHPHVRLAMAGNLSTDRAIVTMLSTAMQSRVIHIEMIINFQEWLEDVAIAQSYDERIVAYHMHTKGAKLMDFRPDHQEKTFCCPRTWEFMNSHIKGKEFSTNEDGVFSMDRKTPLYAGTITSGEAASFVQFCRVRETIVSIEDVLRDPKNCSVPKDSGGKWMVISHLALNIDDKNVTDLCVYANRFDMQYKVLFFRTMLIKHPELRQHPAFAKAMVELNQYLNAPA
jgi:hypothetical protein